MMTRTILLATSAVSALALAACHPAPLKHGSHKSWSSDYAKGFSEGWGDEGDSAEPLKTVSRLDCPEHEGDLTRTGQAADGKSCDYTGSKDETVHLSLLDLAGKSPTDALVPLKTELKALIPAPPAGPVSVEASKGENGDRAKIDLPFLHIDANGNKADVKILGATLHADDVKADVKASSGAKTATVHAGPGGAEVIAETIGKSNASLVYILAGDGGGALGYRAVGYLARGPIAGPLVIGEFRSKAEHHDGGDHNDLGRLIDRNVKG